MTRTKKTTAPAKTKEIGLGFITELDRYLFGQGTHYKIFEKLGAHPKTYKGKAGMYFAVWVPTQRPSVLWAISTAGIRTPHRCPR